MWHGSTSTHQHQSSQGELEHRRLKRFYPRVNKGKFTLGITKQQRRERLISQMHELAPQPGSSIGQKRKRNKSFARDLEDAGPSISFEDAEALMPTPPSSHHHISRDVRYKINLLAWLGSNHGDPALKVSLLPCSRINHYYCNASLLTAFCAQPQGAFTPSTGLRPIPDTNLGL
jgi:hypothetical protein